VQLPIPHEIVRSVSWNLIKHGIAVDDVVQMILGNPRRLMGWT
jgi:hypothetical protein